MFRNAFEWERFLAVRHRARMTRFGGDCMAYCLLAMGQIDVVIESSLESYDIRPMIPLIEAAGGRVTTWDGGRADNGGRIVAAGDPRLHDEVLRILDGP
ncbi:MAG: inositol monophosphatase family protein [Hyphomicrobiaceae bacterium]